MYGSEVEALRTTILAVKNEASRGRCQITRFNPSAFFSPLFPSLSLSLSLSCLIAIFAPGSYRSDRHACLSMKKSNFLAACTYGIRMFVVHTFGRIDALVFESRINFIRSLHFADIINF